MEDFAINFKMMNEKVIAKGLFLLPLPNSPLNEKKQELKTYISLCNQKNNQIHIC